MKEKIKMKKLIALCISFSIGLLTPNNLISNTCGDRGCCTYDHAGNCKCCAAPKKGGGYTCSGCGGLVIK